MLFNNIIRFCSTTIVPHTVFTVNIFVLVVAELKNTIGQSLTFISSVFIWVSGYDLCGFFSLACFFVLTVTVYLYFYY